MLCIPATWCNIPVWQARGRCRQWYQQRCRQWCRRYYRWMYRRWYQRRYRQWCLWYYQQRCRRWYWEGVDDVIGEDVGNTISCCTFCGVFYQINNNNNNNNYQGQRRRRCRQRHRRWCRRQCQGRRQRWYPIAADCPSRFPYIIAVTCPFKTFSNHLDGVKIRRDEIKTKINNSLWFRAFSAHAILSVSSDAMITIAFKNFNLLDRVTVSCIILYMN